MNRFIFVFLLAFHSLKAHAAEAIGVVERHSGQVEILDSQSKSLGMPRPAHPVFEGQSVKTGPNGRILVVFKEGRAGKSNKIILGSNSFLTFEKGVASGQIRKGAEGTTLFLRAGEIRSAVEAKYKEVGKYKVRTRNAVAGVRGTRFYVAHDEGKNRTDVAVTDGNVEFSTSAGKENVPPGHWGFAIGNTKPSKAALIPKEFESVKPDVYAVEASWTGDPAAPAPPAPKPSGAANPLLK